MLMLIKTLYKEFKYCQMFASNKLPHFIAGCLSSGMFKLAKQCKFIQVSLYKEVKYKYDTWCS